MFSPSKFFRHTVVCTAAVCLLAASIPANAQTVRHVPLYTFQGDSFAAPVSGAGDVNNDGYPDLIVAVGESVSVFSGQDGSILYTFDGNSELDFFGRSVSGAGDVNNDGFADFIIAALINSNGINSGSARVFSGQDGSILYTFNGDSAGDEFGRYSVSEAGDVNNDGYTDLIVGAPGDDNNGLESGSARVLSGQDGSTLYTFDGDSAGDRFGFSVSGAGDVNNDGFADLIVGAFEDDNNGVSSGSARVHSGQDGSILYTFDGDSTGDQFGASVSGAGDVNNDGFADFIVGARDEDNSNGNQSGTVRVFSGQDGSALYTLNGDNPVDRFGLSVSGAGDINGDGLDDFIVGSSNNGARVFVSETVTITHVPLYTFEGDSPLDRFGSSVSGAGDVNNDGFADVIVGAPFDDNNGDLSGSARVLSGQDGSALYTFDGDSASDRFGLSVSGAGDVNDDGFADVIVGAPFDNNNGRARVLSGQDGSILYTFNGNSAGDEFGGSVSGAGDVNNDGYPDLIVGAAVDNNGSARVISGQNGSTLFSFNGLSFFDQFGGSVSGAGDVNNDGFADVIVGVSGDDNNGSNSGSARVLSGQDGSILYTFDGDSRLDAFGGSVSGAGDVNNDGFADLIVGASLDDNLGTSSGSARVLSGQDGSILYTFVGQPGDQLGGAVSGAGDVNSDGFDDLIVGSRFANNNGTNSGSVRVISGQFGSTLYTFAGDSSGDLFGESVSCAGDLNGDGVDDFIVGSGANYARVFVSQVSLFILGDVNGDGVVSFLDIGPFIALLMGGPGGGFFNQADINRDGVVSFLDIAPFIAILSGQ